MPTQREQQAGGPGEPRFEDHPRRSPQFRDAHARIPNPVFQELQLLAELPPTVGRQPREVGFESVVDEEEKAAVAHQVTGWSVAGRAAVGQSVARYALGLKLDADRSTW